MGLKQDFISILTKGLQGPLAAKALDYAAAYLDPLVSELRELEVNHELPKTFSKHNFPITTRAENYFQTHAKHLTQMPLDVRSKLHDQYTELQKHFQACSQDFLGSYGIANDSDIARLVRLLERNVQVASQSLLSPEQKRTLELEKLLAQVTRESAEKSRRLDVYQNNFSALEQKLCDLEIRVNREIQPPAPTHTEETRPRQSDLTPTQRAVARLIVAALDGHEVDEVADREARYLARKPIATVYQRLQDEDELEGSPETLWGEQVLMFQNAFDRSSETVYSLHRQTGLSVDAIKPLVLGKATPNSHVNSVVRLAAKMNLPLAGITTFAAPKVH